LEHSLGRSFCHRGAGGAAKEGVDAGEQFAHAEGLGEVIIGAEIEADDLVNLLAFGREHQDGQGNLLCAELFADLVAAEARQHHVEQEQAGTVLAHGLEGLIAAAADGDVEPVTLQDFLQAEEDVWVIFND
jgi:hypothetical protein